MTADLPEDAYHFDDEKMAVVIHGPGKYPDLEARVRAHVASCALCSQRFAALLAADREAGELLSLLDEPLPAVSETAIVAAATRARRINGGGRARRMSIGSSRARRAAAILAAITGMAAAAAAIPATRLHKILVGAFGSANSNSVPAAQAAPLPEPGVFLTTDSTLDVVFSGRNTGGLIHVHVVGGNQASLTSADPGSRYRVGTGRIVVDQPAQANFDLSLPRSLAHVRILVDGGVVFERRNGALGGDPASFTIDLSRSGAVKPN
jgi:hypothetical protein